jgi:prolyl oligopeptidase
MEQQAQICVSLEGCEPVSLVDPMEDDPTGNTAVQLVSVSHNSRYIAYGVKVGGEDSQIVRIYDMHERRVLPEALPRGFWCTIQWDRDCEGFYYSQRVKGCPVTVYYHRLRAHPNTDIPVFSTSHTDDVSIWFHVLPSGLLLCLLRVRTSRCQNALFLVDPTTQKSAQINTFGSVRRLAPAVDASCVIALTDRGNTGLYLVRFSLDNWDYTQWSDIANLEGHQVKKFCITRNDVYVSSDYADGSLVRRFRNNGVELAPLVPAFNGSCSLFTCRPSDRYVFYRTESFLQSPTIALFDPVTDTHRTWIEPAHEFSAPGYMVDRKTAASKDGTLIPYWVLGKREPGTAHKVRPVVMTSYGGFGAVMTPRFSALIAVLLEYGCLFVVVNSRGGGEFGEQWHRAGSRRNRQHSFDDAIAVAESLIATQCTVPEQLGIIGGSGSGLAAGALLTQRPELFGAVVCIAPLLDMLRYHRFDFAQGWHIEFGWAEDADDFQILRAYSPYHQVKPGTAYPAVLFVTGDKDTRCNPMHVRKMTARLQAATTGNRPILVDYSPLRGHSPVLSLMTRTQALTDRICFLIHELRMKRSES